MSRENLLFIDKESLHCHRPKIIAFDGLPGAGKSTAIRYLANVIPNSHIIGEFSTFSKLPQNFPPSSPDEACRNFLSFMEIEKTRKISVSSLVKEIPKDHRIILDRSFLSPLAFEYSVRSQTGFDLFEWAVEKTHQGIKEVVIPDVVFFLDLDVTTAKERALSDQINKRRGLYYQGQFCEKHKEFYKQIGDAIPGFVIFIDSNQPTENIAKDVLNKLMDIAGKE